MKIFGREVGGGKERGGGSELANIPQAIIDRYNNPVQAYRAIQGMDRKAQQEVARHLGVGLQELLSSEQAGDGLRNYATSVGKAIETRSTKHGEALGRFVQQMPQTQLQTQIPSGTVDTVSKRIGDNLNATLQSARENHKNNLDTLKDQTSHPLRSERRISRTYGKGRDDRLEQEEMYESKPKSFSSRIKGEIVRVLGARVHGADATAAIGKAEASIDRYPDGSMHNRSSASGEGSASYGFAGPQVEFDGGVASKGGDVEIDWFDDQQL